MALTLEQALASLRVVSLAMRTKFRGLTQRETALIQGPNGWGEFASFIEYDNKESLHWKFSKINEGTLIKVVIKGTLSFKEKIFSVLSGGITNYAGEAIENSLLKIEDYLVHEVGNYKITVHGLVRQMGRNYIEQKDSCAVKDFPKKSKALLNTMKEFIKNNNT